MRAPTWTGIIEALAEAYSEAARAGAEMRHATDAFESLRDAFNARKDIFAVSAIFDEQIGRAELDRLVPTLAKLRDRFESVAIGQTVESLRDLFSSNPTEGWRSWLETYSRSFDDRRWWRNLAAEIAAQALHWSPSPEWPVDKIKDEVQKELRSRWPDTYDWLLFLAGQDLPPNERATFLCMAAEIQLFHFMRPTRAKELLEQGDELAPGDHMVLRCWGEYWLQLENVEEARNCFDRIVRERPDLADGFTGLGDCCDKANDPSTAETYYKQAVSNAPGMSDGYEKLLNWNGKTEWFEKREALLEPIFRRLLALTDYKPAVWVDLGYIYKQNSRYERARQCFVEAITLDPAYSVGHVWLGYTWLDEALAGGLDTQREAELLQNAKASFERTLDVAPTSLDGYWAMSWMEMQRKEWKPALAWCDRALDCHPEWEPVVRVRRADILRELGRLEEAEQELSRSIELEAHNPSAADVLSELATSFENNNDYAASFAALERWRSLKGESSVYLFQNRVGNLRYRSGDYAGAAERYRLAIAAAPGDDVLRSNLALALENVRKPGRRLEELEEAVSALSSALEIEPKKTEYAERLGNLEAERKFVKAYGEDALKLEPGVTAIRVEVRESVFPDILDDSQNELSDDTLKKANAMRTRIRERYGLTVPGVSFGVLDDFDIWRYYRIWVLERHEYNGQLEPGGRFAPAEVKTSSDPAVPAGTWLDDSAQSSDSQETWTVSDYILHHVESVLEYHLSELFGHQETFACLQESGTDAAETILKEPEELTRMVQVLRSLLQKRIPITSMGEITKEFVRMRQSGAGLNAITAQLAATLTAESAPRKEQTRA